MSEIHQAAVDGDEVALTRLLDEGADVNEKDMDGWSPLHHAASKGHKPIAELLISKGAEVDARDGMKSTPLLLAAMEGHQNVVELLLANGADVNATNTFSFTPLLVATRSGHGDIAELLTCQGGTTSREGEAVASTPVFQRAHSDTGAPSTGGQNAAGKTGCCVFFVLGLAGMGALLWRLLA